MPWGLFFGLIGLCFWAPIAVVLVVLFDATMRAIAGFIDRKIAITDLEKPPSDTRPPYLKF